jgi:lysophospholipase L1-like esterase
LKLALRYVCLGVLAFVLAGCAIGIPGAPTDVTATSATLHSSIYSTIDGPTEAWFSYGEGTDPANWSDSAHQTIDVTTRDTYPLSAPVTGLDPGTTYHWQICARDQQTPAPNKVCSATQSFTTDTTTPTRYVALGDSLTQDGSTTGQRYPERFFNFLDAAGAADVLSNIGISGETSASLLNGSQLTAAKQRIDDVNTDTTVVTIDIGGNDLLGACHPASGGFSLAACQTTIQTFATNLDAIFDELDTALANDPGPEQVIAIEYYNPWSGRPNSSTAAANARLALLGTDDMIDCDGTGTERGFNDVIACVGSQHQAKRADLLPPFTGHGTIGDYFFDDIHPNDTGHQVIANTLANAYEPAP